MHTAVKLAFLCTVVSNTEWFVIYAAYYGANSGWKEPKVRH